MLVPNPINSKWRVLTTLLDEDRFNLLLAAFLDGLFVVGAVTRFAKSFCLLRAVGFDVVHCANEELFKRLNSIPRHHVLLKRNAGRWGEIRFLFLQ